MYVNSDSDKLSLSPKEYNMIKLEPTYHQQLSKKCLQPQRFEDERYETLLQSELQTLTHLEQAHLEQEFADYEQLYPFENQFGICSDGVVI